MQSDLIEKDEDFVSIRLIDSLQLDNIYTLSHPFLSCPETIDYLRSTKVMFLMRGLPGSGKSTLVKILERIYSKSVATFSADHFFLDDQGIYRFDPSKLREAHRICQENTEEAMKNNTLAVIVDNTNIRLDECRFYFQKASYYGYLVLIVEPRTSWKRDVNILAVRNTHGVPREKIEERLKQFHPIIPFYFGVFLNEVQSKLISDQAHQYYLQALNHFPALKSDLASASRIKKIPVELFLNRANLNSPAKFLHCTMKFIGKVTDQSQKQYEKYASNRIISHMMGKMCRGSVIGYVITPRTLSARLVFPDRHTHALWDQDDDETFFQPLNEEKKIRGKASGRRDKAAATTTDDTSEYDTAMAKSMADDDLLLVNKISALDLEEKEVSFFRPTFGFMSRAHLTCGVAPGVSSGQAGVDMVHMVRQEGYVIKQNLHLEMVEDENVAMKYFPTGQCIVYLKKPIPIQTIFNGFFH